MLSSGMCIVFFSSFSLFLFFFSFIC
jgi:hypothetical protein